MTTGAPDPIDSPLELRLQLEFQERSIRGTLAGADGQPRAFTGWLGLLSALEQQRPAAPEVKSHEQGSSGGGR